MRVIVSSNAKLCGRYSVLDSNPIGSHADEKLAGHFDTFRPFEPAQLALNFHHACSRSDSASRGGRRPAPTIPFIID